MKTLNNLLNQYPKKPEEVPVEPEHPGVMPKPEPEEYPIPEKLPPGEKPEEVPPKKPVPETPPVPKK